MHARQHQARVRSSVFARSEGGRGREQCQMIKPTSLFLLVIREKQEAIKNIWLYFKVIKYRYLLRNSFLKIDFI